MQVTHTTFIDSNISLVFFFFRSVNSLFPLPLSKIPNTCVLTRFGLFERVQVLVVIVLERVEAVLQVSSLAERILGLVVVFVVVVVERIARASRRMGLLPAGVRASGGDLLLPILLQAYPAFGHRRHRTAPSGVFGLADACLRSRAVAGRLRVRTLRFFRLVLGGRWRFLVGGVGYHGHLYKQKICLHFFLEINDAVFFT